MKATYLPDDNVKTFCQDALAAQDACNYGALVRNLVRHLDKLKESQVRCNYGVSHAPAGDTQMKHPAVVLFSDKLSSLAGLGSGDLGVFSQALTACQKLANGEEATIEYAPI